MAAMEEEGAMEGVMAMVVAVVRATEAGRSSIEAATGVVLEEAMRVVAMVAVVATARQQR